MNPLRPQPDWTSLRALAEQTDSPWKSFEELSRSEEYEASLHREFLEPPTAALPALKRRGFLQMMAATLAAAGFSGCSRQPKEELVPYVKTPEDFIPGNPLMFATAHCLRGIARGILVESHEGRPTKVEGNPDHPASLGATDIFAQAFLYDLYDPDRSQAILRENNIDTWQRLQDEIATLVGLQSEQQGSGIRILTQTVTSPTLGRQLEQVLEAFPEAKWHQYEPVHRDEAKRGARLAFGEIVDTRYRFDQAEIILSLAGDFLGPGPQSVRYSRDFITGRSLEGAKSARMNRLYVAEQTVSLTGAMADHRLPVAASRIRAIAEAVADRLDISYGGGENKPLSAAERAFVDRCVSDLSQHGSRSLVLPGEQQPAAVHALAHAINAKLGSVGTTLEYTPPVEVAAVLQQESLQELVADMQSGKVDLLLILDGNPVFDAPADLDFAGGLGEVGVSVHVGLHVNETAAACRWHVPAVHPLESWGDARSFDGTVTLLQPLIEPLFDGKSAHEILSLLAGKPQPVYEVVRNFWKSEYKGRQFERFWRTSLHDGLVKDSRFKPKEVTLRDSLDLPTAAATDESNSYSGTPIELLLLPDPTLWDGRYANNAWLQELPKPLTKLTWDNVLLISPATAEERQLTNGQMVRLQGEHGKLEVPAWILPGHADDSATLHFGYGRTQAGSIGNGTGFDAYPMRTTQMPHLVSGVYLAPLEETYPLACTQDHHSMEGRHLVRTATLEQFQANPDFAHESSHPPKPEDTLYQVAPADEQTQWAMAIDLNRCVGCNACVVACQSENNIPTVGKEEVRRGREMHWIRVDRYYHGDLANPDVLFQPLTCMHCESAPCEVVCPVEATVHSAEGLNEMVYNRCIGTRYCSNNCPYKVRRFNYFEYSDHEPLLNLLQNPDVTVRSRGVMEKCTYCVQRISAARISARNKDRAIADGEVVTACQQACPTQAIVFGNQADLSSNVAQAQQDPRNYALLEELNTKPRTTYLARVTNPAEPSPHEGS